MIGIRTLSLSAAEIEDALEIIDPVLLCSHCSIDEDDTARKEILIALYLPAAIAWAETEMDRLVVSRTRRWVIDTFPCGELILPRGKTVSVESVQYSIDGDIVTLTGPSVGSPPGSDYQEDLEDKDHGRLMPNRGESWPSVDCDAIAPVTVNLTQGYTEDTLPKDILHAILFSCSDAMELRGTPDLPAALISSGSNLELRRNLIARYIPKRV